jgi:hypothetical protein
MACWRATTVDAPFQASSPLRVSAPELAFLYWLKAQLAPLPLRALDIYMITCRTLRFTFQLFYSLTMKNLNYSEFYLQYFFVLLSRSELLWLMGWDLFWI